MSAQEVALQPPATRWVGPVAALVAAAVLVYAAAVAWGGSAATLEAIGTIGVQAFIAGTAVSSLSYLVRHARWRLLMRGLGHAIPWVYDLRVYVAGIALSTTPAKLGETVRSVLLLPRGVPVRHTLAAFFGDRLSDVIGVALLGAAAGWWTAQRQLTLEVIAALGFAAAWALARAVRGPWGVALLARLQGRRRWLAAAAAPAQDWAAVWSAPRALACVAAAAVAFGLQALVFGAYVQAVAPQVGLATCIAIFASATLIGAASMIPGGLGAMEAALAWQLVQAGVDWPQALAAVLVVRASTLWFGTLLGVAAMGTLAGTARAAGTPR